MFAAVVIALTAALSLPPWSAASNGVLATASAEELTASRATVQIHTPRSGQQVRGDVPVEFSITADPDHEPSGATVYLGRVGNEPWTTPLAEHVDIPAGSCSISCTLRVDFDTTTWHRPVIGEPDKNLYDYSQALTVRVFDGAGGTVDGDSIMLDNDRPQFRCSTCGYDPGTAGPDGTAKVSYDFSTFGNQQAARVLVWIPQVPEFPDTWADVVPGLSVRTTVALDVSSLPTGRYVVRAVAFTADGLASEPVRGDLYVDHGPRGTADWKDLGRPVGVRGVPLLPADTVTWTLPVAVVQPSPSPDVWTTRAELLFGDRVVLGRELAKSSTPLEVTVPWPRFSYPGGVHPVIFRLTDNRGLTTTQRLGSVELADGARSAFTVSRDLIEEGSRLPMITGSFTAYPGTTIREWRVQVDDRVVASGSCPGDTGCPNQVPVSVRWPGDEDFRHVGSHSVLVTADDDLGVHHARLFHVTAVPATRTKLTVSDTRVSRGAMVKVKASIKDSLNRAVRGATVRFQRRPAGTRSWTTIATRLSDRRGVATLSVKMRRTVDVRAIVLAKPARWGGSRTRAVRVRVARQP